MHNGAVRLIKACYVAEITAAFEAGESRCWQFIEGKRVCGCGKTFRGRAGGAIPPRQLGTFAYTDFIAAHPS